MRENTHLFPDRDSGIRPNIAFLAQPLKNPNHIPRLILPHPSREKRHICHFSKNDHPDGQELLLHLLVWALMQNREKRVRFLHFFPLEGLQIEDVRLSERICQDRVNRSHEIRVLPFIPRKRLPQHFLRKGLNPEHLLEIREKLRDLGHVS